MHSVINLNFERARSEFYHQLAPSTCFGVGLGALVLLVGHSGPGAGRVIGAVATPLLVALPAIFTRAGVSAGFNLVADSNSSSLKARSIRVLSHAAGIAFFVTQQYYFHQLFESRRELSYIISSVSAACYLLSCPELYTDFDRDTSGKLMRLGMDSSVMDVFYLREAECKVAYQVWKAGATDSPFKAQLNSGIEYVKIAAFSTARLAYQLMKSFVLLPGVISEVGKKSLKSSVSIAAIELDTSVTSLLGVIFPDIGKNGPLLASCIA